MGHVDPAGEGSLGHFKSESVQSGEDKCFPADEIIKVSTRQPEEESIFVCWEFRGGGPAMTNGLYGATDAVKCYMYSLESVQFAVRNQNKELKKST